MACPKAESFKESQKLSKKYFLLVLAYLYHYDHIGLNFHSIPDYEAFYEWPMAKEAID